jgi:hypothetical protein
MGHNLPYIKSLYHQRRLKVGLNVLLKDLEKIPMILDPYIPTSHTCITFPSKPTKRDKKEEKRGTVHVK